MTRVVFRKFKDDGEIIALFPEERYGRHDYTINSYMHVGQHSAADYDHVVAISHPAREDEYRSLLAELISIGYDDLRVMQRCRPKYS
jgi:erythromycin esterase-like protein